MSNAATSKINPSCLICGVEQHSMLECELFERYTNEKRWEHVKRLCLCFNCLSTGHRGYECETPKCEICQHAHHKLLHRWDDAHVNEFGNGNYLVANGNPTVCVSKTKYEFNERNLLQAFLPIVKSKFNSEKGIAMATTSLDSSSEINILSKKMAKVLGLRGENIIIDTIGVGGISTKQSTKRVTLLIEDKMGFETQIEAIVLDKVCGYALPIPNDIVAKVSSRVGINPESIYSKGGEIDLLLGMGNTQLHEQTKISDINGLCLIETRFGPSIVGTHRYTSREISKINTLCVSVIREVDLWRYVEADMADIKKECPCLNG